MAVWFPHEGKRHPVKGGYEDLPEIEPHSKGGVDKEGKQSRLSELYLLSLTLHREFDAKFVVVLDTKVLSHLFDGNATQLLRVFGRIEEECVAFIVIYRQFSVFTEEFEVSQVLLEFVLLLG